MRAARLKSTSSRTFCLRPDGERSILRLLKYKYGAAQHYAVRPRIYHCNRL